MSLAVRRHHRERIKRKRRHYWGRDLSKEKKYLGIAINTPTPCGGYMCQNPRKNGEKTIQERRHEQI